MANFSLTLPDAQLPRLVAAVAQQTGQDASVMNAAQKAAMVKQAITNYLLGVVQANEVPAAQNTARDAKIAEIASGIQIT